MGEIGQIPNHQVKVDNWPLFFLQRLHHFYRKKSHCDLTLLFSTLDTVKSIKVHKLVLHACTDYFESLDVMKDSEHGEFLQLSNEMHPDVVIPIISFMYTGKLEFPVTLQPRLYEAATKLRMTILTKLLDVQPSKTCEKSAQQSVDDVSVIQSSMSSTVESSQDVQEISSVSADISSASNITSKKIEDPIITLTPVSRTALQMKKNLKPEVTFIQRPETSSEKAVIQNKAKCSKKNVGLQFTTVSTKPKVVDVNLPPTLPGRKLPVWKRKLPFTGSQSSENIQNMRSTLRSAELPKPTRFEWDEDLNDPTVLRPVEDAPKILSHDGPTKISHPIILDDEESRQKETLNDSLKRSSDGSCSDSPPYKKSRSDLQDMKEYGEQQQLRNEILCSEENLDDMMDTDDLYGTCDDEPDDLSVSEVLSAAFKVEAYIKDFGNAGQYLASTHLLDPGGLTIAAIAGGAIQLTPLGNAGQLNKSFNQSSINCSTPKPILKTMSKPEPPMSSKRVRFSLEGKENNQQQNETSSDFTVTKPASTTAKQKIVVPMDVNQIQSGKHHVKIVSEVLKKYPNLAKRENIKLRVVSKNPAAVPPTVQKAVEGETGGASKSASSLVSYIFLTNKSSGEIISVKNDSSDKDKGFDVENKTGPWFCRVCNEASPIEFDSYYTYRRHLVEVHELKIDARICEYCGLKNSKRNHLLYHLYTKHGINPPAHISFPKCPECDYIALSDALLFKHKATHDPKGLMCYTCNVVFKTYSAMQLHLHSDWHRNKLNEVSVILSDYPCPFCEARFESGNDLKDHMETSHHSQRISTNEGHKQIYRCPYCESLYGNADFLGKHIVSVHWGKHGKNVFKEGGIKVEVCQPQSGQQLQYTAEAENSGDTETTENQPSSELESLNSVASGIATSLSLVGNEQTVVYYEHKTDDQDIGREAIVAGDECKEYVITESGNDVNEKEAQGTSEKIQAIVENEDSNSRASNTEEVNPTSCSDHDYSEPQIDENYRQVIPVHPVGNQITESSVIQQIVPDQGLVFANQGNVVFQSPCVNLPQRVLLTSGKVVLPRVSGEQNVILSQVIPQTQIILSGSILQPPGNIIDEGNGTIVFANPETTQMENIQTVHYQIHTPENVGGDVQEKLVQSAVEEESQEVVQQEDEKEVEIVEITQETSETENVDKEKGEDESNESNSDLNTVSEDYKTTNRVETSKIVDDWDEMNESSHNVESRGDGPSRPEFF